MIELSSGGVYLIDGCPVPAAEARDAPEAAQARERTIAYGILRAHDGGADPYKLRVKFDALVSHDITYVGIIQTARASGMTEFPIPYAMTNCHNSLCAVGGTINEDDHAFGLSAAIKYGGIYVPANQAVIHQYAREALAGCGRMILGSDSHTRYGCYGTLGVGEGGGELAKQLLGNTYDADAPEVVLVWLEGEPPRGVGPHDVALALVGAVFPGGLVKNKLLEFLGPGAGRLSMDFRAGLDVMTTETGCLSSVWATDDTVRDFYRSVGRPEDFRELRPGEGAYYDSMVRIDLSRAECMIALPFHPSKAYAIHALQREPERIFAEIEAECNRELDGRVTLDLRRAVNRDGKIAVEQGVIVGCSGGMFENICEAADILRGRGIGDGYFDLSVYPASSPVGLAITKNGVAASLMESGAVVKPAFCGPCFGAGDTPAHNTLSIRHATRNFASREGSKPGAGQIAAVALMDARSIAATARMGGILTAATDIEYETTPRAYAFDGSPYKKRCYNGFGRPDKSAELRFGPNIADWPAMHGMRSDLLLRLCAVIRDDVTTTDELIPSGETSSYRSNPIALSEFTLSRRCPEYTRLSKDTRALGETLRGGGVPDAAAPGGAELAAALEICGAAPDDTTVGSCLFAKKPGDGSAREQAASCQKILGGWANICYEYATKRYRSNCINWGIVPFTIAPDEKFPYTEGDWIYVRGLRDMVLAGIEDIPARVVSSTGGTRDISLRCAGLTDREKLILTEGSLINFYAKYSKNTDEDAGCGDGRRRDDAHPVAEHKG
ncbi:MAG: hydratase [Oscillospiraceae bacterium]|jgi:aconitate hydratase|nr:hydratase [Oscillospiraceae bacterium]